MFESYDICYMILEFSGHHCWLLARFEIGFLFLGDGVMYMHVQTNRYDRFPKKLTVTVYTVFSLINSHPLAAMSAIA